MEIVSMPPKNVTSYSPIVIIQCGFSWISATNRDGPKTKSVMNHVQASSPRFWLHGKVCFALHMRISNIAEWNVMCKLNDSPEQDMVQVCYWTRIPFKQHNKKLSKIVIANESWMHDVHTIWNTIWANPTRSSLWAWHMYIPIVMSIYNLFAS